MSLVLSAWLACFLLFPAVVIDGQPYNPKKIGQLQDRRALSYEQLYASLQNEIDFSMNYSLKNALFDFYRESEEIDSEFLASMDKCTVKFRFPFQKSEEACLEIFFPAYIKTVENNNLFYSDYALSLFAQHYEKIINSIMEDKTDEFLLYADYYSYYRGYGIFGNTGNNPLGENFFNFFLEQCIIPDYILSRLNFISVNVSSAPFFNIPVIEIDGAYYSAAAIEEIRKSMETAASAVLKNIKSVLIGGINKQTEIYSGNIDSYVDWYFSFSAGIGRTFSNIIGFFTGYTEEDYYKENFYRIMNENADLIQIIEGEYEMQMYGVLEIYYEYMDLLDYFSVNESRNITGIMAFNDYIEPFINEIINYTEQVFEALNKADNFFHQEYTVRDNEAVNLAKISIKALPAVNFFAAIALDYASIKTQQALNSRQLWQQIYDSMTEIQMNKKAIVNDPFNYLYDRLKIGSILFVDNYFAGFSTYQHYGVYVGDGKVVHYAPLEGQEISFENGIIHETTLEKFLDGRALQIDMNAATAYSESEILYRAYSRINEREYNLLFNNCEHFARWCVTGNNASYQVLNFPENLNSAYRAFSENKDMILKFLDLFSGS